MVEANQILEKSTENPLERVTVVYFVTKYCYLQTSLIQLLCRGTGYLKISRTLVMYHGM